MPNDSYVGKNQPIMHPRNRLLLQQISAVCKAMLGLPQAYGATAQHGAMAIVLEIVFKNVACFVQIVK
jgi:hypothetical protein